MRLRGRPTLQTLAVLVAVFALQHVVAVAGPVAYALFVLDGSVAARPWTLLTSVYAHSGTGHLLANAAALVVVGPLVARRTTPARFHAYFLTTGAVAGLSEVVLGGIVGPPHAVVGASGAILALLGYLLSGNVLSARLLDRVRVSARVQVVGLAAVVGLLTLATSGPGSAVFGHAAGLACGLVAGRWGVLDVSGSPAPDPGYRL